MRGKYLLGSSPTGPSFILHFTLLSSFVHHLNAHFWRDIPHNTKGKISKYLDASLTGPHDHRYRPLNSLNLGTGTSAKDRETEEDQTWIDGQGRRVHWELDKSGRDWEIAVVDPEKAYPTSPVHRQRQVKSTKDQEPKDPTWIDGQGRRVHWEWNSVKRQWEIAVVDSEEAKPPSSSKPRLDLEEPEDGWPDWQVVKDIFSEDPQFDSIHSTSFNDYSPKISKGVETSPKYKALGYDYATPYYDITTVSLPERSEYYLKYISRSFPEEAVPMVGFELPGLIATDNFIKMDGNCQFRALSYIQYQTVENYDYVREQIIDWLQHNHDFDNPMRNRHEYIAKMRRNGEWGDEITLAVAAKIFRKTIVVLGLSSSSANFSMYHGPDSAVCTKLPALLCRWNHYELLFRT